MPTEAEGDWGIVMALDGVYGRPDEGDRGNPLLEVGDVGATVPLFSEGGGDELVGGGFDGDGIVLRARGEDDKGMAECWDDWD